MTDEKQQPSAFPNGNLFKDNRGLTMRDYFATQAMNAIMGNATHMATITHVAKDFGKGRGQAIAEAAYEIADAMMAARKIDLHLPS